MAINYGTIVQATVRPPSTSDQFPVFYANEGKGGYVIFDTIEQRDAHPAARRESGMPCYVTSENKEYRLDDDLVTWVEIPTGGGTASSVAWADVTGKPSTFTPSAHTHAISEVTGLVSELATKLDASEKGEALGVAELGADGKVLPSQLPVSSPSLVETYIVGVTEFATDWLSITEGGAALTPVSGITYVIMSEASPHYRKTFMWGGSTFVEISPTLALGETSTNAYRGDRGKAAYDHSQATHAPANAQKNSDITKAEIEAKLTGEITSHTHPVSEDAYSNPEYPSLTTQAGALDFLLYTPVTATYTSSRIYDLGLSIVSLPVAVTLNKDASKITSFTINTDPGGANTSVNLKALMSGMSVNTDVAINPARTANTTFPMTIVTPFESVTKDINVAFYNRKYYGYYGTAGNNLPSMEDLENDGWAWATSRSISLTTAQTANPNGKVFWYCYPESLGAATFTVNGFGTSLPYMNLNIVTPGGITVTMRCYYTTEVKNVAFTFTAA